MNTKSKFLVWLAALMPAISAHAQVGSGWTQYSATKRIHLDGASGDPTTFPWSSYQSNCSPTICADYRYDSTTGIETFRLLDTRSNRSEIRLENDYYSGRRQFEGWVRVSSPTNDEAVHQVFGRDTASDGSAPAMMIRAYSASGGTLTREGGGKTLITGIYGVWVRVNTLHDVSANKIDTYINGSLKDAGFYGGGTVKHYHKYGCYGSLTTSSAKVEWKLVKLFRDGSSATPTSVPRATPTPTPTPTAPPSSTPTATPTPTPGGSSGYYKLIARHSGKAVTVSGASTANSADVIQWTYGGAYANDEWQLVDLGTGYHRIVNRHSGKVLNVAGASTANGANVDQWSWASASQQQWQIVDLGNGYHRFTARHSGKVLNVSGASTADGANVDQWSWANVNQQMFEIVAVP